MAKGGCVHGRGHVWWGACMAGGMCGKGGVHGRGACMAGGVCGKGACIAGGMHDRRDIHCSGRYA